MAKGRMLNKSISLSMKFHLLPDDTCRLLATWLIPQLDKRGVFYGDAAVVKSLVLPMRADVTVEQVREYLKAMQHAGLIRIFEDGGRLWQVWPGFNHNQVGLRDDRETTDYATPPSDAQDNNPKDAAGLTDEATDIAGNLPADIRQTSGEMTAEKNRSEMNEKEGGAADATPILSDVSQGATVANATSRDNPILDGSTDYFNRATKPKSQKATITAWKGQQHLKDVCITLCDVTGLQVTKGDAGKWMKGAVALHELGATDEILRRVWNEATPRDRQFMTHPAAFTERVRSALANQPAAQNAGVSRAEWVTTPAGKILRYDGVPYPGDAGRQKCVELGIAYEGN